MSLQNLNTDTLGSPSAKGGLVTDPAPFLLNKEVWTYARNTVLNSHSGNIYALQNEPSTIKCVDLPYTFIGSIGLIDNRFAVFTTDNTNSEIGIFDATNCTYTTVVNDPCLGFNTSYLISGKSKYNFDCSETIYWADSGLNPRRYLNLSYIPYRISGYSGCTPIYTNQLDCNKLLVDPNIVVPIIQAEVVPEGNLKNGTYQFAMAYSIKKERISDIYSFTNPVSVFSYHNSNATKGIKVNISGLDTKEYDEFELFVGYTIDNFTSYKSLGFYNITQSSILISSIERPEYNGIDQDEIFIKKPYYDKADWCEGNDQYLLWGGLSFPIEVNYQLQAMNIQSNYVIVEVPSNFYKTGNADVGYYGDEVYAFGIQWLRSNGSYTDVYHIPGTTANSGVTYSGNDYLDVYESGATSCYPDGVPPPYYVKNTAIRNGELSEVISGKCDMTIVASGVMAYWQSTLDYPDNDDMFGSYKCHPIRHHKFPNEAIEPRFHPLTSTLTTGTPGFIRIKAIKFSNIEHPKDINGNYLEDIVGYRILRSDRSGNRTVIARGYSTNMRYFQEREDPNTFTSPSTDLILYPNYPYNDLGADPFLGDYFASTVTVPKPDSVSGVSNYDFTFYSPHGLIGKYAMGNEVIFETDELGYSYGSYKHVYEHPKFKLLSTGGIEWVTLAGASSLAFDIITEYAKFTSAPNPYTGAVGMAIYTGSIFLSIPGIMSRAIAYSNQVSEILQNTSEWQDYCLQYDSYCLFNTESSPRTLVQGHRRFLNKYTYLSDGLNPVPASANTYINNFKKPNAIYLNLGNDISGPSIGTDVSRQRMPSADVIGKTYVREALNYYTTIKRRIPDQYGVLDSVKYINTDYEQDIRSLSGVTYTYETDVIFGGDCFINQFSVNQPQPFFTNYPLNTPNGYIWDYRNYRNIAYPKYWLSSQPYSVVDTIYGFFSSASNLLSWVLNGGTTPLTAAFVPESRFSLDDVTSVIVSPLKPIVKAEDEPAHMYTSYNGSAIIFVESDFNLDFRNYTSNVANVYTINSSLGWLYRSDNLFTPEEFVYDLSYSKQNTEVYAVQQSLDFNVLLSIDCYAYWPNLIIYSLPAGDVKQDHWLYYLQNNQYTFPLNDFGNLISFHAIDNQQIIFFFDKAAPYVSIGRDELQTENGIKVTIGDAGLFARPPRPIDFTDYSYGSCTSRFAFKATAYGNFYPGQKQGKIFGQAGLKLKDISNEGNKYWFSEFLPSQLLNQFPNFKDKDNPVVGTGLVSTYEPTNETYILTKKDYKCIDPEVTYISATNSFVKGETQVYLTDPVYFEDASWTVSYRTDLGVFVSWHDYHPIGYMQGAKHFMSIDKGIGSSSIWKHNEVFDSYCNFYDRDYPFAIQLPLNNQTNIEAIRSFEFYAETYVYKTQWDYFHVLDTTFDYAIVSNSEQVSGWLHLNPIIRNQVSQQFLYPYYNSTLDQYEVKIDKVENRYRFNQFWDITKDRGEYSGLQIPLILTESNGYKFDINPVGVDYAKPQTQRKKFRHKTGKVYLEKEVSANNKITLHFSDTKQTQSPR